MPAPPSHIETPLKNANGKMHNIPNIIATAKNPITIANGISIGDNNIRIIINAHIPTPFFFGGLMFALLFATCVL